MEARDILIRPLITERTTQLMAEVNTVNVLGKTKRMGRTSGKRPDYKKAIVKLAAGESIEFFEA